MSTEKDDQKIAEVAANHQFTRHIPGSLKAEDQEDFLKKTDPGLFRITQLAAGFNRGFEQPQIMTLSEFEHYTPLFDKDAAQKYSAYALEQISKEFGETVDFFRPIHVVMDEGDKIPLITIPQIFTTFQSLKNVKDTELSGINERIGSKDPYINKGTVAPYVRMIEESNISDENLEAVKKVRLETYELLLKFKKMKEDKLKGHLEKQVGEETNNSTHGNTNDPQDGHLEIGIIEED